MDFIRAADVFQLFWSRNSMTSPWVRQEWEYALSLGRAHFIRPTYWETPMPEAPERDLFYFDERLPGGYESWLGIRSLPKLDWGSPELRRRMTEMVEHHGAGPDLQGSEQARPDHRAHVQRLSVPG